MRRSEIEPLVQRIKDALPLMKWEDASPGLPPSACGMIGEAPGVRLVVSGWLEGRVVRVDGMATFDRPLVFRLPADLAKEVYRTGLAACPSVRRIGGEP